MHKGRALALFTFAVVLASCGGGGGSLVECDLVCSEYGTCAIVSGAPRCFCLPYYVGDGMTCVATGSDAGSDANADSSVDAGFDAGPTDRPPRADCQPTATLFPAALPVQGSATDLDGNLIQAFSWRLATKPAGSTLAFANPGTPSFSLMPDVAGRYDLCLTVTANDVPSSEVCCDFSAAASFEWALVASRSTQYVEEVVFNGGLIEFSFDTNQVFTPNYSTQVLTTSNPSWAIAGGGGAYSVTRNSVQLHVDWSMSSASSISVGDQIALSMSGTPELTGPANATISGAITLGAAPDPGAGTPRITSFATGSPFAGVATRVTVTFDASRPAGAFIEVGGKQSGYFTGFHVAVHDDGLNDDVTAGDGVYSGRFTFPASGTYNLILRPAIALEIYGPYFRASTIVVP